MNDDLTLSADWTDGGSGPRADPTAARLRIEVAGRNACRVENLWSRSVDDTAHLSALPLASWLAGSWWRLRWEGEPASRRRLPGWRMAHEVAAAGEGFLWPCLAFLSDGEAIRVECRASESDSPEMLRYLASFDATVPARAFEAGVDGFLALVLERLGSSRKHPLALLWAAVLAERADPTATYQRRLEAMLGFDPDEAPDSVLWHLSDLSERAGAEAAAEVAAACAGPEPQRTLDAVLEVAGARGGVRGRLARDLAPGAAASPASPPTQEGSRHLAGQVREAADLAGGPVPSDRLGDLLGLTKRGLLGEVPAAPPPPLALGISGTGAKPDRFVFRRRNPTGRRFEAARLLYDGLTRPGDGWHPATDADTARQKTQRAFAAEFLVPIADLEGHLDGDFSPDAIEDAAEHYGVSSHLIGSHLANNRVIRRDHPAVPAQ